MNGPRYGLFLSNENAHRTMMNRLSMSKEKRRKHDREAGSLSPVHLYAQLSNSEVSHANMES